MYNFLVNATKYRLIQELKEYFSKHPIYKKIEIYNRKPYKERVQEGIVVKNSSANRNPLSADNFQGTVYSYIILAEHKNNLSMSLEWAREDSHHLCAYINKVDMSNNTTGCIISFNNQILKGGTDLNFADQIKDVKVWVNNQKLIPKYVDGKEKTIILPIEVNPGDKVEVSYWIRNLAAPGIYQIEIIDGNPDLFSYHFLVDALLEQEDILIEEATGSEISASLSHRPIFPKSLRLWENDSIMTPDIDYSVDENTGVITFLNSPLGRSKIIAEYRVKGLTTGPFELPTYNYAHNTAIPGVVLAFGRAVSVGDKHFLAINKKREISALEYSGKWEMNFSLDVYAKDTYTVEELIDITTTHLHVFRKSELDSEGIALVDVTFGGESEELFDEATGDSYYLGSVDYSFLTEWIMHKPLLRTIEGITIDSDIADKNYFVNKNRNFEKIL